jgi:hypothetical protein
MRDPWSLMYGEYEQGFIDALRKKIRPKHPLYNQEVYAIAVRRNPEAVLYQAFNPCFLLANTINPLKCRDSRPESGRCVAM